jgi:hypothetical protein
MRMVPMTSLEINRLMNLAVALSLELQDEFPKMDQ